MSLDVLSHIKKSTKLDDDYTGTNFRYHNLRAFLDEQLNIIQHTIAIDKNLYQMQFSDYLTK